MRLSALLLTIAFVLAACEPAETPAEPAAPETTTTEAPAPPSEPINLNTGTAEQFGAIPGVGERMIHEFEEYRPYTSIEQFRQEIGKYVDEAQVAAYEEYVFVPVDWRETTAATIEQLPGVSAEEAGQLAEGLPYASADEFLTAYESIAGEADAEAARAYLAE